MTDTNKERAGRFTKKPVTIDAWLIDPANKPHPSWVHNAFAGSDIDWCPAGKGLYINTLEGHMLGGHGDYLIRGVQSELYACKAHIFAATYEPEARASLAANAPAAPTGWYALAADGMATLCVDRDDAEKTAAESEKEWPNCGPFRAVQLYTAPPATTEQWVPIETAPKDAEIEAAYRKVWSTVPHTQRLTAFAHEIGATLAARWGATAPARGVKGGAQGYPATDEAGMTHLYKKQGRRYVPTT